MYSSSDPSTFVSLPLYSPSFAFEVFFSLWGISPELFLVYPSKPALISLVRSIALTKSLRAGRAYLIGNCMGLFILYNCESVLASLSASLGSSLFSILPEALMFVSSIIVQTPNSGIDDRQNCYLSIAFNTTLCQQVY